MDGKQCIKLCVITLILNILSITHANGIENEKLKVSLYYEALCPYCIGFINDQLYPAHQRIGQHLSLELVPYGNANRKQVNGKWIFDCQHGPNECMLNKIEACGLARAQDQNSSVSFVHCVERQVDNDFKALTNKCASILDVHADKILKCANGAEGDKLLAKFGEKTDAVQPPISGVPTVLFNDYYNDTLENDAVEDFFKTACELLQNQPASCQQSINNDTENEVASWTFLKDILD